jgi:hypothetical protein
VSNGTNGSPATLHAKSRIPVSAAVSMARSTGRPKLPVAACPFEAISQELRRSELDSSDTFVKP